MIDRTIAVDDSANKLLKAQDFSNIEEQASHLTGFLLAEFMVPQIVEKSQNEEFQDKFYNLLLAHLKIAQDREK